MKYMKFVPVITEVQSIPDVPVVIKETLDMFSMEPFSFPDREQGFDLTDFIGHTIDLDEWLMLQSECLHRHCGTWEFIVEKVDAGYHVKGMTAR